MSFIRIGKKIPKSISDAIVEAYKADPEISVYSVATRFGISSAAVKNALTDQGIKLRRRSFKEKTERNKKVVELANQLGSQAAVARRLKISKQRVHQILKKSRS